MTPPRGEKISDGHLFPQAPQLLMSLERLSRQRSALNPHVAYGAGHSVAMQSFSESGTSTSGLVPASSGGGVNDGGDVPASFDLSSIPALIVSAQAIVPTTKSAMTMGVRSPRLGCFGMSVCPVGVTDEGCPAVRSDGYAR